MHGGTSSAQAVAGMPMAGRCMRRAGLAVVAAAVILFALSVAPNQASAKEPCSPGYLSEPPEPPQPPPGAQYTCQFAGNIVTGHVTDARGNPLQVLVELCPIETGQPCAGFAQGETDANGRYAIGYSNNYFFGSGPLTNGAYTVEFIPFYSYGPPQFASGHTCIHYNPSTETKDCYAAADKLPLEGYEMKIGGTVYSGIDAVMLSYAELEKQQKEKEERERKEKEERERKEKERAPTPNETKGYNPSEPHASQTHGCAGHPCDTATGNFSETYSDVRVPGRGLPLSFSHTYNSLDAAKDGPLGFGWTFPYGMSLTRDTVAGTATIRQENSSEVTFTASGGQYTAPARVDATLVKNPDGSFTFTRRMREVFSFSAEGQLTSERDLNGYVTTLSYNSSHQLTQVTDPAQRSLLLSYTGSHLTKLTDPLGRTVSFAYDGQGNLSDVTDVAGGMTHFTYDANDLLLTMTDPRGATFTNHYDAQQRVDAQTDQLGRTTTLAYATDSTTITDPKGNVTVDQYENGLRVATTKGAGTPKAATWRFAYDPATLGITSITDPNGHVSRATYDAHGNRLTETDALGRTTTTTYDALEDPTSSIDPAGVTTTMAYDAARNLQSISRPLTSTGQTQLVTYHYDDAGHPGDVTAVTDPGGQNWHYSYDSNGDLAGVTDPLGNRATDQFNAIGWRTAETTPKGNTTRFARDDFGDPTSATDALGHKSVRHYDPNRNLDAFVDPDGHTTRFAYDAANQLTIAERADGTKLMTAYDGEGNLSAQTDALGHSTSYEYDPLARLSSVTDPLGRRTSFAYDGAGNRTALTDPQGQITSYSYDAADELSAISYSDGTTPSVSFGYDANGQRTSMRDGTGASLFEYDSLNRLIGATDGAGNTVGYGYDIKGQLTSLVYPGGHTVTRSYDPSGRLAAVADWLGHRTSFSYDGDGNLVGETFPGGVSDAFSFDKADRLMAILDSSGASGKGEGDNGEGGAQNGEDGGQNGEDGGGQRLASFKYKRDAVGFVTSVTARGVPEHNQRYAYDALGRLTQVNHRSYAYDANDRITALLDRSNLSYDNGDQLASLKRAGDTTNFSFDPRGNRTGGPASAGASASYRYDQANRLIGFGSQASYAYSGDGLRADKAVNSTRQHFVWDAGSTPSLLADGTGQYIYGPGGLPIEQISGSGSPLFYHHDQLGSTRLLSNLSGHAVSAYAFDPYGNLAAKTGNASTPLGYAGQYTDAESGLQYLRARYYDPASGQLMSRDPITQLTHQPYSYAGDSPLNAVDPTGLCVALPPVPDRTASFGVPPAPPARPWQYASLQGSLGVAPLGLPLGPLSVGLSWSITVTDTGHWYLGGGFGGGHGLALVAVQGHLNQPGNVDQFIQGESFSGGAGVGPYVGFARSFSGGSSTEVGWGVGGGGGVTTTVPVPSRSDINNALLDTGAYLTSLQPGYQRGPW
jgi:RHS repeat-associated protein